MSSATVSSAQTPSFYSMNGTMRLNGTEFASGLDTQSLIKALTANISSQIDKQKQLEQKAEWRRDAFRAVEDLLQKFSDTYFSYSTNSPLNIMSNAFFDSEDLISSNSSIVSATGAQSDAGNVVIDKIGQLATAATYTGGKVSNESIDSTEALGTTISAGSYLNLKLSGKSYTISLGKGIDTANPLDTDGHSTTLATALQQQLQAQINANSDLKDIVSVDVNEAGTGISLTGLGAGSGVTITGASQNFISGLGLSGGPSSYTLNGTVMTPTSLEDLGDQLAGTTLTVQLDGLSKTITFDGDESLYNTPGNVRDYLQGKMDTAFGKDSSGNSKVKVEMTDGKLSLTTPTDPSSVLQFTSSSKGVLGYDGLLHIRSGETNRLELDKTLDELNSSSELNTGLVSTTFMNDGKTINGYEFVVNGKEFAFDKNTELNTVINTINDDTTANVNISYSQTLNRFRIVSDDTGAQGSVKFHDEQGNFTKALFGGQLESKPVSDTVYQSNVPLNYKFTIGGTSQDVTISNYNSLNDIAAQIQSSLDASTSPLNNIAVGLSPDKESLTFKSKDGSPLVDSPLKIAFTGTSPENDILGFGTDGETTSTSKAGNDLSMSVELGGTKQDITRSTNSFTLDGITMHVNGTLNANGVTTDSPIKFSSSNNVDDLYKKISDFVDKYNEIVDKINTNVATMPPTQSTGNGGGTDYEPLTDDQKKTMTDAEITDWNKKAQQGLLFCDPQMSALQTDIRTAMEGNVDSVGMSLAAIGISTAPLDTTSGGKLIISTDKLKDMLKSDPDKVAQLFTNADGIASRVKNVVKKNIGEFGNSGALFDVAGSSTMIGEERSEIGMDIANYDKNIKDLQTQLKNQQDSLQAKFTNMEMIISQLSSQYNYMSSMASS